MLKTDNREYVLSQMAKLLSTLAPDELEFVNQQVIAIKSEQNAREGTQNDRIQA